MLQHNLVQALRRFDRVGLLVYPLQLLQGSTLGLNTSGKLAGIFNVREGFAVLPEEVPEDHLEEIPSDKDPKVVGRDGVQSDRGCEMTDETDGADHEARQS